MTLNLIRSKCTMALVVAAATAIAGTSAQAAIVFTSGGGGNVNVASDTGDRHTVAATLPVPVDSDVALSGLYGAPTLTEATGTIKLDFASLSSQFRSAASSSLFNATETVDTDGKLVLTLHFNTASSLSASIYEDGLYSTTGSGSVAITGGGIAIETVGATPAETHGSSFTTSQNGGVWTATANVASFNGKFTDFKITVDNDIRALAPLPNSSADIFKKDFILTITPNSGEGRTPEPASLGVLTLGAMGLLARRRR